MKKMFSVLFAMLLVVGVASAYSNGFETDLDDWLDYYGTIERVASGTAGVPSSDGSFHATLHLGDVYDVGPFSRWGGYETIFPASGYTTSIDIYLDMSLADGSDLRADFSSAINNAAGNHLRDFIFHFGTVPNAVGQFAISASNNAPGWPANPGADPLFVSETGWYTFKHVFYEDAGVLAVDFEVYKDGSLLKSWTRTNANDVIANVGGNRYGWFATNDFEGLPIDNAVKTGFGDAPVDEVPEFGVLAALGVLAVAGLFILRKRQ